VIVATWLVWAPQAQAGTITFHSNQTWQVWIKTNTFPFVRFIGFAQNVCPSPLSPTNCPAGATLYGFPGISWTANLSNIPGATWIWAPRVTGATTPAGLAQFFFVKVLTLSGAPTAGIIHVAVDDFAEVIVNGKPVGAIGSVTDESVASAAQSSLTSFNITPFLITGPNLIAIRARNGSFGGCNPNSNPTNCTYATNPAGVVFGGSIEFQ